MSRVAVPEDIGLGVAEVGYLCTHINIITLEERDGLPGMLIEVADVGYVHIIAQQVDDHILLVVVTHHLRRNDAVIVLLGQFLV